MVNLERNTQSVNLPWIVWQLTAGSTWEVQNEYAQAQFVDMNSKPSLTIDTSFVLVGHSNAGDNSGGE